MPDLEVQIDQDLVDKTLRAFTVPWDAIDYASTTAVGDPVTEDPTRVFERMARTLRDYTESAFEIADTMSEQSLSELENGRTVRAALIERWIGAVSGSAAFDEFYGPQAADAMPLGTAILEQSQDDAIQYAGYNAAAFVLSNVDRFSADSTIIVDADRIAKAAGALSLIGLGSFFRKLKQVIANVWQDIWHWIKRQLTTYVHFGPIEMRRLLVTLYTKPRIKLGNPLRVDDLNPVIRAVAVDVPYEIRFLGAIRMKGTVHFNMTANVGVETDSNVGVQVIERARVVAYPEFREFKIHVSIVGIDVPITITALANKIVRKVLPDGYQIYDTRQLVVPIRVLGIKYSIAESSVSDSGRGLDIRATIDVQR